MHPASMDVNRHQKWN
uniref:Uncharacterized protein n=1 Tax=Arundo donax TaxID=35708 RepID=A0A0A8ZGK4_ARUDO